MKGRSWCDTHLALSIHSQSCRRHRQREWKWFQAYARFAAPCKKTACKNDKINITGSYLKRNRCVQLWNKEGASFALQQSSAEGLYCAAFSLLWWHSVRAHCSGGSMHVRKMAQMARLFLSLCGEYRFQSISVNLSALAISGARKFASAVP